MICGEKLHTKHNITNNTLGNIRIRKISEMCLESYQVLHLTYAMP